MGSGRRPLLPALLLLLLLLPLPPAAWGDCGPLPSVSNAEPLEDTKHRGNFSVNTRITYRCLPGYVKSPSLPDTIQCLPNSQWSTLREFCSRSCPVLPRLLFARISQADQVQNFYPVGVTVRYDCRPGYENITDQPLTSTCLDNLTWSAVPELCQKKSCGIPANPEHGKVITNNHLFGARADVVCNRGYTLKGASPLIWCYLRRDGVAWSQLPVCQAISCPPPPPIPDGEHNGNGTEEFTYDSVVMYACDPGLQLVGNETLRCTTENGVDGVWSGSPPECRVGTTATPNQTESLEEKTAEDPHWLASILIPCCIVPPVALGVLAGIIMRWRDNRKHSYNMRLQKHETKGRDAPMHPKITDDQKQLVPWHSYFCHTTSCHVCPTCEERLHADLAPGTKPMPDACAACEDWVAAQLGAPHTYLVSRMGDGESQSPAGTSSRAEAADVLRDEGAGEAVPARSEAEQPTDHGSDHHICPVCENWLRAHLGQCQSRPAAPEQRPEGPHRQDECPSGPVCLSCDDRLHLSLVHSDVVSCPVCPLAGEGTLAHLVSHRTPGCHVCPICTVPTHAHLCQPRRINAVAS